MTSATVTQLGEMIANISNNMGNMDSQNGEFAGIFQTAAEKSDGMEIQQAPTTKTSVTEKPMNVSKKGRRLNHKMFKMQKKNWKRRQKNLKMKLQKNLTFRWKS